MKLKDLENKKILILGLGKEGIDSLYFLSKVFPEKVLGVADRLKIKDLRLKMKDKRVRLHLGENYLKAIPKYDVVIKSPGIPVHLPEIERALKQGKITSQTEIFFDNFPGQIVGITGTKGKGTAATLIYRILKEGGKKAYLVGNIGKPPLSTLFNAQPKDIFVYELSSHQLLGFRKSPKIAVLLNIYPAHLDYFKNFREYLGAKTNIIRYQTKKDYLIFSCQDKIINKIIKKSSAEKIPFGVNYISRAGLSDPRPATKGGTPLESSFSGKPSRPIGRGFPEKLKKFKKNQAGCFHEKNWLIYRKGGKSEKIISIDKISLKGDFNLLNVMPGILVGKIFRIPSKKISKAIREFKTLPYRLEFIGKYQGIEFYNDSLATIPEAACQALEALGKNVQTIFLGGYESFLDYKGLAQKVLEREVKTVILFPANGKKIWKEICQKAMGKTLPRHFFVSSMKEAVRLAYQYTKKGKICLLSPASPSFGLFKDYRERGNLFKKYVKSFASKKILKRYAKKNSFSS